MIVVKVGKNGANTVARVTLMPDYFECFGVDALDVFWAVVQVRTTPGNHFELCRA
jgi:hypothetical protein